MRSTKSLLLIDNEPVIRKLLTRIVEREGFEVTESVDPSDAMTKISNKVYACIISNIMLPDMHEYKLIKEIKKVSPESKIIVSVPKNKINIERQILSEGADLVIYKPFNNYEIAEKLKKLFLENTKKAKQ